MRLGSATQVHTVYMVLYHQNGITNTSNAFLQFNMALAEVKKIIKSYNYKDYDELPNSHWQAHDNSWWMCIVERKLFS